MSRIALSSILLVLVSPLFTGCGSRGAAGVQPDAEVSGGDWVGIHHPYFPVPLGAVWAYEGHEDGCHLREEVQALEATQRVGGVECVVMAAQRYLDDVLVETTLEWYAEDQAGNVWTLGEQSMVPEAGGFVLSEDSWLAGEGGWQPVLFLPAQPAAGELFQREVPGGTETMLVSSTMATADLAIGSFTGCLEMIENPDDVDADIILYVRGVGRAVQRDPSGDSAIVLYRRPR